MGCDIHLTYEQKDNNGKWVDANIYNKAGEILDTDQGRNYTLFGILADVRSSHFLGPISEPKGLPDDATEESINYHNEDNHSHTWFTLQELMVVSNKYLSVHREATISSKDKNNLETYGEAPQSWCRSTSDDTWSKAEWWDKDNSLENFISLVQMMARVYFKYYNPDEFRVVISFDN